MSSMRRYPGFLSELQQQIEELQPEILERISRHGGLEIQDLLSLILEPRDYSVDCPDTPDDAEIFKHDNIESYTHLGKELISNSSVALCLLAGGAGTRIGGPKCLLNLYNDETLLSQKIRKNSQIKNIWILVTETLAEPISKHLEHLSLLREGIEIVKQYESVRLSPNNQLFLHSSTPSLYPCGHGDAIPALEHSGILKKFTASGGKHVIIMNVDNFAVNVDASILGLHHANNVPVTCEVVKKQVSDKGGVLCKYNGINQIVEEFRFTAETDSSQFQFMNTNTMIVKADLDFNMIDWHWHRVKKNLDGSLVIQYERLLQQLTEHFKTQFVEVQRDERFTPIKSAPDLDKLRQV